jgi:cell division protein FtsB
MTVASLQHQQREIDELKAELAKLRRENAALKPAVKR